MFEMVKGSVCKDRPVVFELTSVNSDVMSAAASAGIALPKHACIHLYTALLRLPKHQGQ